MTKPNFKEMDHQSLRKYVLAHREDEEAIHELFINRSDPNGKVYPKPDNTDGMRIMEEELHNKVQEIENKQPPAA